MDWTQALTIIGANIVLLGAMIGILVSLFLHSGGKIEAALKAINEETKDFHGRLCAIEERNKPRIL